MHRFMKLERGPWERGRGLRGRKSWSTCDVKVGRGTTRRQNGTDKKGPGKLGQESCHRKAYFMLTYKERINIKKVQQVENRFPPQSYWNGGIPSFPLQSPQKPEHSQNHASLKPCVHHPPFPLSCHAPRLSGLQAFSWMGNNCGAGRSKPVSQRMPICSDRGFHSALWTECASGLLTYE